MQQEKVRGHMATTARGNVYVDTLRDCPQCSLQCYPRENLMLGVPVQVRAQQAPTPGVAVTPDFFPIAQRELQSGKAEDLGKFWGLEAVNFSRTFSGSPWYRLPRSQKDATWPLVPTISPHEEPQYSTSSVQLIILPLKDNGYNRA